MRRIELLRSQLGQSITSSKKAVAEKKPKIVKSADYFMLDSFLTPEELKIKNDLSDFLKKEVSPYLEQYNNTSTFPRELIMKVINRFPGITTGGSRGHKLFTPYSSNLNYAIGIEISRADLAFGTSIMHQVELGINAIMSYGSQEHIDTLIPDLFTYNKLISFNLTEPDHGSDASKLSTTAVKEGDYFILNGTKRWAANVMVADLFIIWAMYEGNVRGFIVDGKAEGLTTKKIENKLSLRSVQNGDVNLKNVKTHISNLLPRAESFEKVAGKMLLRTRLGTGLAVAAACMEAYDLTAEYTSKRIQFGKPLCSFQLVQDKLVKSMANIQAMIYFTKNYFDKIESENGLSLGKASLCKSYCTQLARETIRMLRELWGGNGIIGDNKVMRFLTDIESLHTYEGTYEINTLIVGREITGISAIK